jgi:hypothetical protein
MTRKPLEVAVDVGGVVLLAVGYLVLMFILIWGQADT